MGTVEIVKPNEKITEFRSSLRQTLHLAEALSRLGLAPRYASALKTFQDYGSLIELAFENQTVLVEEMLYFGRRGGHIGIPEIETFIEGGDPE